MFLLDSIHSMSFLSPTEEIQKQPVPPGACTLGTRVTASLTAPDPRSRGPDVVAPGKGALPCVWCFRQSVPFKNSVSFEEQEVYAGISNLLCDGAFRTFHVCYIIASVLMGALSSAAPELLICFFKLLIMKVTPCHQLVSFHAFCVPGVYTAYLI